METAIYFHDLHERDSWDEQLALLAKAGIRSVIVALARRRPQLDLDRLNEFISYARRVVHRDAFDPDRLAVEAIQEVGPSGAFINHAHTHRYFRDNWFPELSDRDNYAGWANNGGTTFFERARAKTTQLIETHQPEPLPAAADKELERIVADVQTAVE